MATPRLTTMKFRVWSGDPENPTEHMISGVGRDVQRTESMFAERGWGATTTRPVTAAAAVAYFAMKRTGEFTGKWEQFEDWYLSVEPVEQIHAVPTEPEQDPVSPLK